MSTTRHNQNSRVYSSNSQCDRQRGIFALSKTFFRRNTDVFQGKMTRHGVKRPAVRVRWEFSDTPIAYHAAHQFPSAKGQSRMGLPRLSKNLVEFAPAGDAPHVVPPRGIAASACAKKVPPALFLNAAVSDKTRYARQVWNLCASSAQIMRAAGCSLFKREPSPRGSRLRACQKDVLTSSGPRFRGSAAPPFGRKECYFAVLVR